MWYIVISEIEILKILIYISDHEHLLVINAKFHSSMMNIKYAMSQKGVVSP